MFVSPRRISAASKPSILFCLILLFAPGQILAQHPELDQAPVIFDLRKSLPLEPDEPVYHDFYINAGTEAGFKKGMYVTVYRLVPIHDPLHNRQQGELQIEVAKLRVIHVARNLSVARLHSLLPDEERPALEFEAVMIGDRIDPASATMQAPQPPKKKSAQSEGESDTFASTASNPSTPSLGGVQDIRLLSSDTENASQPSSRADIVRLPVPAAAGGLTLTEPSNPASM